MKATDFFGESRILNIGHKLLWISILDQSFVWDKKSKQINEAFRPSYDPNTNDGIVDFMFLCHAE